MYFCSEALKLHVFDCDFERGTLLVRQGKGKKDRMIPLGERAGAWVEKYLADGRPELVLGSDDGHLFLTTAGESFTPSRLTQLVRTYVNAAHIKKTGSCHLFRHTMATLMLEGGADIRYIQAMLRHVSLETTQIYTQVPIRKLMQIHSATHPGATLKRRAVEDQAEDHTGNNKTDIADPDETADPDPTEADLLHALATDAAEEVEDTLWYTPIS